MAISPKIKSNLFGQVCSSLLSTSDKIHDIISFSENEIWGLGIKLRPVQKFILKTFYGLPLEDKKPSIRITDKFKEKDIAFLTEKEYLELLIEEKRTNLKNPSIKAYQELVLVIGRRGTKSVSAAIVASYEAYKLTRKYNPHEYYNILDADVIRITNVANSVDQATKLFKLIQGNLTESEFFSRFLKPPPTITDIEFYTPHDLEHYGQDALAKIRLTVAGCNARAIRGGANIVVIHDEIAHFINNFGNRSDREIYDALTPSTGDFGVDGKILNLSSPLNKAGKFYELYQQSFQDPDILMLQIPSWEANAALTTDWLKTRYRRDPARFMMEFGANFSESINSFVEDHDKLRAVVTDRPYLVRGSRQKAYFLGIDLGLVKDGTGISLSHVEWEAREQLDLANIQFLGSAKNLVPVIQHDTTLGFYAGVPPFQDKDVLIMEEVVDKIAVLCRDFNVVAGVIDQWCGPPMEQSLKRRGLNQIELVHFTQQINSDIYTTLKNLYLSKQVSISGGWESQLVQEMLTLEKATKSNYLISVECPQMAGFHDDLSDSLARSIWLAFTKGVMEGSKVALATTKRGGFVMQNTNLVGGRPNLGARREMYKGRVITR